MNTDMDTDMNMDMNNKFQLIETKVQLVLSVKTVTSVGNLPQVIGKAYESIFNYLNENGVKPVDAPFTAYYNRDMENLEVEIGFPVAKELAGKDEIIASQIPAGKKVISIYHGAYQEMGPTYEAMMKWISERELQPTGVVYEFYYNSPMEVPENELMTKIMFLIK